MTDAEAPTDKRPKVIRAKCIIVSKRQVTEENLVTSVTRIKE